MARLLSLGSTLSRPWPNRCCVRDVLTGAAAPRLWPKARISPARALESMSAPGSAAQVPRLGYTSRATLGDIQTFEQSRRRLSRLPSMARGRAFTPHALAFLGAHSTPGEGPSQGPRMAQTVPWADCGAQYPQIARRSPLPVREQPGGP